MLLPTGDDVASVLHTTSLLRDCAAYRVGSPVGTRSFNICLRSDVRRKVARVINGA
jgi:hypothetical protein